MPGERLQTVNPATGEPLASWAYTEEPARIRALERSETAAAAWQTEPVMVRAGAILRLADVLDRQKSRLASAIVAEMGKPVNEAVAELEKCVFTARWYAENGPAMLEPEIVAVGNRTGRIVLRPLGPVLGIMPWNFPFWQVLRFAVPALLAGNTVLLKHAPNVTGCALLLGQVFNEAGWPAGVFQTLVLSNADTLKTLEDPAVQALSFTGSTATGRMLAAHCGRLLKPSVLELGGSDAFIVLDDADVELAVQKAVASRFINSGQSCIAAKRIIVTGAVYERFKDAFLVQTAALTVGNPEDPSTRIGPLARPDLCDTLTAQVDRSVAAGAHVVYRSAVPERGYFFPVTVLENAGPGMPVCDEETFGPVAPLIRVRDEAEAVAVARQSPYALGAAVFTSSPDRFEAVAARLPAGACYQNELVFSDARLPFGGNGPSGWGRELSSYGLKAFCNVQSRLLG